MIDAPLPGQRVDKWVGGIRESSAMDDSPTVLFGLEAENEVDIWLGTHKPMLAIRCQEKDTDALIRIGGSASVESGDRHTVEIRFDEEKKFSERWSESNSSDALFAPNPIKLIKKIAESQTMLFRFVPFNASPQIIRFDIRGFDKHIGLVRRTCDW